MPLREEVEFVAAYLQVEQARLGLRLWFDVSPAAAPILIPAMRPNRASRRRETRGLGREGSRERGLASDVDEERLVVEVNETAGFPPGFSPDEPSSKCARPRRSHYADGPRNAMGAAAGLLWQFGAPGMGLRAGRSRAAEHLRGRRRQEQRSVIRVRSLTMKARRARDCARCWRRRRISKLPARPIPVLRRWGVGGCPAHPDVLLLDIQMPGSSRIDVAACLPHPRPHIIFCTAFDQYAVDAFELHAADYLLKPQPRPAGAGARSHPRPDRTRQPGRGG